MRLGLFAVATLLAVTAGASDASPDPQAALTLILQTLQQLSAGQAVGSGTTLPAMAPAPTPPGLSAMPALAPEPHASMHSTDMTALPPAATLRPEVAAAFPGLAAPSAPAQAPGPSPLKPQPPSDAAALPPWAGMPAKQECGGQQRQQLAAAASMGRANAARQRLDMVLYGDSMTAMFQQSGAFRRQFGDLNSMALGMCGSSVANLVWRILEGGERPVLAPRVVAVLIGINNLLPEKELDPPAPQLEWLVGWMRAAWPQSEIVVAGLLPTVHEGVRPDAVRDTNTAYSALAQRQGAAYVACGQDLDPSDTGLFGDGLHPAGVGQDLFLSCLRVATQPYFAA
ncbi:hypothetical protein D9Q98_009878 [Chlorella vulgaris]|uniref:SGNH hydrolase-type esterase domain-containing protein n=1 Tax=Chlorella vulgaris TaxID=3077 RepID=A0A9D4TFM5_CHLVU|nr:hypothetical protein D9Q98_009878 [Chlorella vulgaris]